MAGRYCTKAHNQSEPKHHIVHLVRPNLFPGLPTCCILPIQDGIHTHRHCWWGGLAQFTKRRRPCGLRAHQDRYSQHRYTRSHQEQFKKIKLRTTNRWSKNHTHTTCQPWKWLHIGGQFWTELQQLILCQVTQKLAHKLGHHAINWGPHPRTLTDTEGHRRWALCNSPSNGAPQPVLRDQPYQQQDHPVRKPPREQRFSTAQHPTILAALTPDRHLGSYGWASATSPRWGQQIILPRDHGRPPQSTPQGRQQRALQGLPGLGAPKSWKPSGWRNQEYGMWQAMWENLSILQTNATMHLLVELEKIHLIPRCWDKHLSILLKLLRLRGKTLKIQFN